MSDSVAQIFLFNDAQVRAVVIDGEPWFVGKDVAERLGYAEPGRAIRQHCKGGAKHTPIADAMGRIQQTRIIAEPDVLRLIVGSNLPAAKEFARWVFETVLPTLRRTGRFEMAGADPAPVKQRPWHERPLAERNAELRTIEAIGRHGNSALAWWYLAELAQVARFPRTMLPVWKQAEMGFPGLRVVAENGEAV